MLSEMTKAISVSQSTLLIWVYNITIILLCQTKYAIVFDEFVEITYCLNASVLLDKYNI